MNRVHESLMNHEPLIAYTCFNALLWQSTRKSFTRGLIDLQSIPHIQHFHVF